MAKLILGILRLLVLTCEVWVIVAMVGFWGKTLMLAKGEIFLIIPSRIMGSIMDSRSFLITRMLIQVGRVIFSRSPKV